MPSDLVGHFDAAAQSCDNYWITGAVLAAQVKAESNFRADAVGSDPRPEDRGKGMAQFTDATWRTWGAGGDPFKPADAIAAQGRFMCALSHNANVIAAYKAVGGTDKQPALPFVLAGFNAGPGRLHSTLRNGDGLTFAWIGVPPFEVTQRYIGKILDWSGQYEGMDPQLIRRVQSVLNASNHNLWLRYGHRSIEEQQRLWDTKVAELNGNTVEAAKWVANPAEKRSRHLDGQAADINGDLGLLARLAPAHELTIPMSYEPWHVKRG